MAGERVGFKKLRKRRSLFSFCFFWVVDCDSLIILLILALFFLHLLGDAKKKARKEQLKQQIVAVRKAKEKMLFGFPPVSVPQVVEELDAKMSDAPSQGIGLFILFFWCNCCCVFFSFFFLKRFCELLNNWILFLQKMNKVIHWI